MDTALVAALVLSMLPLRPPGDIESHPTVYPGTFARQSRPFLALHGASPSMTLSGVLEALVIDDFAEGTAEMQYSFRTDYGVSVPIHFQAARGRLPHRAPKPGAQLTITGRMVGESFFAATYEEISPAIQRPGGGQRTAGSAGSTAAGSALEDDYVLGEQGTLVLLLNFLDDLSEPNTIAEVEDMVFNDTDPDSVNSRLQENSYGKAWLAGDILGWLTLPINAADCAGYLWPYSSTFQNTVDFVDPLVDFSLYTRIIVLKPGGDCTVGAVGSFGDITIETDEGQFKVSLAHSSLNGFSSTSTTLFHELGHNFKMTHHSALECGDVVVGDYADGCDSISRGDRYDLMAKSGYGHHNASSKRRLGWFDPQNIAELGTGTYQVSLSTLELPSNQVQTIRIPAEYTLSLGSESAYYVIEYRQAIGLDSGYPELADPQAGVLIRLEEKEYLLGTHLLDMSPHVTTVDFTQDDDIAEDAFLRLGQTFTDMKHDITVTFSGLTAGAAVLTVDVARLCNDGICDPGEDSCGCPGDCGQPAPADCTLNGIPDECEPDCNNNGVADSCDIADGTSDDCPGGTGNGIPDECDPQVDCNANGVIDSCDIAADDRGDLNANGIPDDCELHEMVYVDNGNCPGPGSGTVQDPFCNIQDAIDAQALGAGVNDVVEIIVADGIYAGDRNKNLDFAGRLITVRSAGGPDNCIIDMEGSGRGFYFHSGESAGARVEGLTIRNGYFGTQFESNGSGIYCVESSPTIIDCTITGNTAESLGGGIALESRSYPTIRDCRITGNLVSNTWGTMYGGGIHCSGSSPSISNCIISDNSVVGTFPTGTGGGISLAGGSNPTITGCTISNNVVNSNGGGIGCTFNSNPTIRDCLIADNSTLATNANGEGGGLYAWRSRPTLDRCTITGNTSVAAAGITFREPGGGFFIRNCLIAANHADRNAAALQFSGSGKVTIENCTIARNTSAGTGAGIVSYSFGGAVDIDLTNCILWGNGDANGTSESSQIDVSAGTLVVSYCDIQGLTGPLGGVANFDADPLFIGETNLRLSENSPCIDAGDSSAVTGSTDIAGNPRIWNGIVDVGAYETAAEICQPGTFSATGDAPCAPCPAGTFQSEAAGTGCFACDPGTFAPTTGSASCDPCPTGAVQPDAGASECLACSPGTFAPTQGLLTCSPCTAGTAQPDAAGTECIACSPGTFAAAAGSASCGPCPADTFQPAAGASECVACDCNDGDPSTVDSCDSLTGSCLNLVPIPAASTWSLICFALLLMCAATILMRRALERAA